MSDGGFAVVGITHSFGVGNGDLWLLRMDRNGTLIWNHTVGDPYGNGGASFVYEGNNTFICAGSTLRIGDPFQDMWVVKVHINILSPTNSTANGNNLYFWIILIAILAVSTVSGIIIWKYISKKSRAEEYREEI